MGIPVRQPLQFVRWINGCRSFIKGLHFDDFLPVCRDLIDSIAHVGVTVSARKTNSSRHENCSPENTMRVKPLRETVTRHRLRQSHSETRSMPEDLRLLTRSSCKRSGVAKACSPADTNQLRCSDTTSKAAQETAALNGERVQVFAVRLWTWLAMWALT